MRKIWGIRVALVGRSFSPFKFLDLNSSQRKAGMVVKPQSCILIKQTSRWAPLIRAAQMDHSSFQQTNHRSIIHAVKVANLIRTETKTPTNAIFQAPRKQTPVLAPAQYDTHDGLLSILSDDFVQPHDHVIIIVSMAVVQCMKQSRHEGDNQFQKRAFVKRNTRIVKPYDEGRIIFDCCDIAQLLKQKTGPSEHRERRWNL